jgi:membrane fusion protein (multidrug efflux system)
MSEILKNVTPTEPSIDDMNKVTTPEKTKENNSKKAKKKIGLFLLIIIIIGGLYGTYFFLYGKYREDTENAYVTGDQIAVTSQIGGSLTDINFVNTSKVKKGDLLVQIEDTDYKLALEGAKIELAQAVRQYYSLGNNVSSYEQALNSSLNTLKNVQKNYNRNYKSYKAGLISKQNMDASTTQLENAKLDVTAKRVALKNAKLQASSKDVYSHPAVQGAILKYKQAALNLSRTKIYAPVDGIVAKKSISIGQKIGNGHPLFSIIDLNNEWVEVNLKENQLKGLEVGNTVELKSSLNGKVYKGYVVGIEAGTGNAFSLLPPQNATGNWIKITQRVPVRVAIDKESLEKNGVLPLGTTMEATVNKSEKVEDLPEIIEKSSYPYVLNIDKLQKTIDKIVRENKI